LRAGPAGAGGAAAGALRGVVQLAGNAGPRPFAAVGQRHQAHSSRLAGTQTCRVMSEFSALVRAFQAARKRPA
jgi:hypothetical protein